MRAAIERQFEIIGETLNRAITIDETVEERITDIRKIVAFRHQIIHGYDVIDHDIVWGVIERYLKPLMREVHTLLEELDG